MFSGHGIRVPWTPGFYLASLILSLVAIRAEDALTHYHLYKDEALQKEQVCIQRLFYDNVIAINSLLLLCMFSLKKKLLKKISAVISHNYLFIYTFTEHQHTD